MDAGGQECGESVCAQTAPSTDAEVMAPAMRWRNPAVTDDTITHEALAPCPFCGDPQTVDRSGILKHAEPGKCLIGVMGWPVEQTARWNTRAPLTGPEVAAIRAEAAREMQERCAKIADSATCHHALCDHYCHDDCPTRTDVAAAIRALTDKETDNE